jgi:hypothetical protein
LNIATVPEIGHTNIFRTGTGRHPERNFILAKCFKISEDIEQHIKAVDDWPGTATRPGSDNPSRVPTPSREVAWHRGRIHPTTSTPQAKEKNS